MPAIPAGIYPTGMACDRYFTAKITIFSIIYKFSVSSHAALPLSEGARLAERLS